MSIENEILLESDNQNLVKEADAKVRNIIVDLLKTGSVQFELDSEQYKLLRKDGDADAGYLYIKLILSGKAVNLEKLVSSIKESLNERR